MIELLQEWVTQQAERRGDARAVVFHDTAMTYGELERSSSRLARALGSAGCRRGDRVGVLLPKSLPAIIGILGTLKADCAYVPIDPGSPPARVARMLLLCEARCVLTSRATQRLATDALALAGLCESVRVGWMDPGRPPDLDFTVAFSWDDLSAFASDAVGSQNRRRDMAHILFTSGSTGVPKGVVITHANVIHFVQWATRYFGMDPADRNSCHPPLHFDLSTFDIFGTFASGAQLHLVPPELSLLPHRLAEFIRNAELTQWFSVPSILTHLAKSDVVEVKDFPALRRVLWCGETFPTPSLIYWMSRLPHVSFTNLYGPTEATIASSFYRVPSCPDDERAIIPIGRACEGEELLVLDDQLQPVPPGEVGELYIGGVGLSPGYWNDAEKTQAVFLRNPFSADPEDRLYRTGDLARRGSDGLVYLVGRADSQVKSRGYRIELGEIETALNAIDGLQESAVVAIRTDSFEGTVICCAYVPAAGTEVAPSTLRRKLAELLPHYMLPARWMRLTNLPRNANGKVDRPSLKEQFQRHDEPVA